MLSHWFSYVVRKESLPVCKELLKWLGNSRETIQSTDPKEVTNGLGGFTGFIRAKMKEITKYCHHYSEVWCSVPLNKESAAIYTDMDHRLKPPPQTNKMCERHWKMCVFKTELKFDDTRLKILPPTADYCSTVMTCGFPNDFWPLSNYASEKKPGCSSSTLEVENERGKTSYHSGN